jgi:hypothetical protein
MTRISSGILLTVVTLVGTPAVGPVLSSSVVYAEVSDQQIMDKLLEIKRTLADLEGSLKAKNPPTDATRREKLMPMLNEIDRILKDARAYGSN